MYACISFNLHPNWDCTLQRQSTDTDSKEPLYLSLQSTLVVLIIGLIDVRDKFSLVKFQ